MDQLAKAYVKWGWNIMVSLRTLFRIVICDSCPTFGRVCRKVWVQLIVNEYNFSSGYTWTNKTKNTNFRRYVAILCHKQSGFIIWLRLRLYMVGSVEVHSTRMILVKLWCLDPSSSKRRWSKWMWFRKRSRQLKIGRRVMLIWSGEIKSFRLERRYYWKYF